MQVVEARAHSAAGRDAVWTVVADARGWSRWGGWESAELEREGNRPVPPCAAEVHGDTVEQLAREAERS